MKIDDMGSYLNSIASVTPTPTPESPDEELLTALSTDGDTDTYTSTQSNPDIALPSENYNDIVAQLATVVSESSESETNTSDSHDNDSFQSTGSPSWSGGDESSETQTEVVFIHGLPYLQTTTTNKDGSTTVKQEPMGNIASI